MCYAILRVSYKNGTEPVTLKEVETPEDVTKGIAELREKPGVQKITSYFPYQTIELVSEWKTSEHKGAVL